MDIVARLQFAAKVTEGDVIDLCWLAEAADEIKRLRVALHKSLEALAELAAIIVKKDD